MGTLSSLMMSGRETPREVKKKRIRVGRPIPILYIYICI